MITTRYPIKVAGELFPKGSWLRLATLDEVRKIWPAIAPEKDSKQVAVIFPGRSMPTIVEKSQIDGLEEGSTT
jgi:hypothetical protein